MCKGLSHGFKINLFIMFAVSYNDRKSKDVNIHNYFCLSV